MKGENAEVALFFGLWGLAALALFGSMAENLGSQYGRPMTALEAESLQKEIGGEDALAPIAVSHTGSWRIAKVNGIRPAMLWRSLELKKLDEKGKRLYLAAPNSGPAWIIKARNDKELHRAIAWMVNQKSEGGSGE